MGHRVFLTDNGKIWQDKPSLSTFVSELASISRRPKYLIKIGYAFEAVYFTFFEGKIYMLLYSIKYGGWIICFTHTSQICKNYIPCIQDILKEL